MSLLAQHKRTGEPQQNEEQNDNNFAGLEGLGEVGRPDWMEDPDSSDDDKAIGQNRNNFDLKMPESRKFMIFIQIIKDINFQFIRICYIM